MTGTRAPNTIPGRRVDSGTYFLGNCFDRGENGDTGLLIAQGMSSIDGILNNVSFVREGWIDVNCRVGDEQWPRVERCIDHKNMTHPAVGSQLFLCPDRRHELVGMQGSFHQSQVRRWIERARIGPVVRQVFFLTRSALGVETVSALGEVARTPQR